MLGIAQTGTGKTAAFALPMLQRLSADARHPEARTCRALVLSPTRELASQIGESFRIYGRHMNLTTAVVFGGVSGRPQVQALARGVDILVATPGRLIDHLDSRVLRLDRVEIFVLDEADQMLDMGFIQAIRRIVPKLPRHRQSLFFSATMPRTIAGLADELLHEPQSVAVTPVASTVETVKQRVIFVETARKRALLADILRREDMERVLVFTRTKHGADRVVKHLESADIGACAIHGNKNQAQRERALASFKSGQSRVLIATDIAARGIDIDAVSHVVNFDLPHIPESYVHRIGRTARAGAAGVAISFCDAEERSLLRDIEKLIRQELPASGSLGTGITPSSPASRSPLREGVNQGRPQLKRRAQGQSQGQHASREHPRARPPAPHAQGRTVIAVPHRSGQIQSAASQGKLSRKRSQFRPRIDY